MTDNCFYCSAKTNDGLNGIDRANNNEAYVSSNCVSCCGACNRMKISLDPGTFIARCRHISYTHGGHGERSPSRWISTGCAPFHNYVSRAHAKGLAFDLTKEDFHSLTGSKCFYCHRLSANGHVNGIDRVDSSQGYTRDNCVTSCGECNMMKQTLSAADFVEHCKHVASTWQGKDLPFSQVPKCLAVMAKRGVTWRALQGAVVSRPSRMDKYSMLDDDEDGAMTDEQLLGLDELALPAELS